MKILQEIISDSKIIDILQDHGIYKLYPPQGEALPYALDGKNIVLSVPTAGGKSLVAYLTIMHRLSSHRNGKALYVVPLRALAREKYEELKLFEKLGFRIGISTGDLHESNPHLSRYDVIVCTSEKADSLLRHGVNWLSKIVVLVVDEIHLIHDPTRGPTLEVIISRFKALNPRTQIVALSATIKNASELADWLDGKLISSDWRPVPLKEGVFYRDHIMFDDGSVRKIENTQRNAVEKLVEESILDGGQVLVFVNTRRSTVSLAKTLSNIVENSLSKRETQGLKQIVESLKQEQSEITSIGKELALCLKKGVAFHNAGLTSSQRKAIEKGFKNHLIKCIVATPTLAAGINIPARRVIIRDLWRYDPNLGMKPIPILEYKQQAGRAGRPRYDTIGEAITIAKNHEQQNQILYNYILADTEPIYSKLGSQAALRTHLLSAIATQFVDDNENIHRFINSTFYAHQQSDIDMLKEEINNAIRFLLENRFIEQKNKKYIATLFGIKTSSLYIDPLSALQIRKALEQPHAKTTTSLSYLHTICSTPDIPSLYLRGRDTWIEETAEHLQKQKIFLIKPPDPTSSEYEWFLSDLKTALLLEDWINEETEEKIVSKYNIGPGDIHSIVETAEWLLYAAREFARMYNFTYVPHINELILRVHNGCKKELLNLITLKGIGRIRARALYNEGFKTINQLRGVPIERIAKIKTIGKNIAANIKKQIGEKQTEKYKELDEFHR
ncbi:MAG: extensin [Thermoplasmata archaeon]|nr:MAG: extensin [Thermoplasmata archaeon]